MTRGETQIWIDPAHLFFPFCDGRVYSEISRYYCPRRLQFSHDVEPRLKIILENSFDYKVVGAKKNQQGNAKSESAYFQRNDGDVVHL